MVLDELVQGKGYFMHKGGVLIAMRVQFDGTKRGILEEVQQCIFELWKGGDGGTWNIHGTENRGDLMLVCSSEVFFEDIFFICDGKEGEYPSAAIVDDADKKRKSFLLEREQAREIMQNSEITDDE